MFLKFLTFHNSDTLQSQTRTKTTTVANTHLIIGKFQFGQLSRNLKSKNSFICIRIVFARQNQNESSQMTMTLTTMTSFVKLKTDRNYDKYFTTYEILYFLKI